MEMEQKQIELLENKNVDVIILARYMQILSGQFVDTYRNRIINIHHSSLPAFAGADPYRAAFRRGVKFIGATSHYVTEDLDEGPIIAQDVIPISHRDSMANMKRKGKDIEKVVLAKAIYSHITHHVLTYKNKTVVFE
jgi:formyltetrahydrofolate deformylase